jgi:hypothetical protein
MRNLCCPFILLFLAAACILWTLQVARWEGWRETKFTSTYMASQSIGKNKVGGGRRSFVNDLKANGVERFIALKRLF